jgi:hypothetical protein
MYVRITFILLHFHVDGVYVFKRKTVLGDGVQSPKNHDGGVVEKIRYTPAPALSFQPSGVHMPCTSEDPPPSWVEGITPLAAGQTMHFHRGNSWFGALKMAITTTFAIRRIGTLFLVLVMRMSLICHTGVINRHWETFGNNCGSLCAVCKSDGKMSMGCVFKMGEKQCLG